MHNILFTRYKFSSCSKLKAFNLNYPSYYESQVDEAKYKTCYCLLKMLNVCFYNVLFLFKFTVG